MNVLSGYDEREQTPLFLPMAGISSTEYSDETARIVDEEIKKLLSDAHAKVRDCLGSRRQALEKLAKVLLEKEVVGPPATASDLESSCGRRC